MSDDLEVAKWYTRARRFPQLIGRTPDGTKIPGGPYTFTQVLGGAAFLVVAWKTLPVWGVFGLIGNAAALVVATWLLIVGLGKVPIGARNPITLAEGAVRAMCAPAGGRVGGREVRLRRPHRARTVLVIAHPVPGTAHPKRALQASRPRSASAVDELAAASATTPTAPAPTQPIAAHPPLTSVQRILAGADPRQNGS